MKRILGLKTVRTLIVAFALMLALAGGLLATNLNGSASTTHAASNSAAYTFCANYSASEWLYGPNFPTAKVNVTLCTDGSHVRQASGVSCQVQQFSGSSEVTWCGVYNNGGSFVEPGVNFTEHYPWGGNQYCYFRFHVNSGGSITSKWGSC